MSAAGGCAWTASTSTPWITITGGASGTGNGSVTFTVTANPGSVRTGTISIGTQTHTVTQAGSCTTTIAPPSQSVPAAGGDATSITVTAAAGCGWTATPSQNWITITSGASGTGNGSVGVSVAANTGPARTATVTIAGQTHTVSQATGCTYTLAPTSHSLDKDAQTPSAITVTTAAGCTWTAVSNNSFITVVTGASGTGPGTVTYRVSQNNGNNPRTGTLTIAGRTFTVIQDNNGRGNSHARAPCQPRSGCSVVRVDLRRLKNTLEAAQAAPTKLHNPSGSPAGRKPSTGRNPDRACWPRSCSFQVPVNPGAR